MNFTGGSLKIVVARGRIGHVRSTTDRSGLERKGTDGFGQSRQNFGQKRTE